MSATLTQKIHSETVPQVVLISTYDLGHQPFGLASPAAWLSAAGVTVRCFDLAVEQLDEDTVRAARMVAVYVPMHTATRMAAQVIPHVRKLNPDAHVAAYGLYAPMNRDFLSSIGADSVIGGEFEEPLRELAEQVALRREDITGRNVVSLGRQLFMVPDRTQLPSLTRYAGLRMPDGARRTAGYTEASRGCKHLCRHCPIVPVYGGRFRVVQRDVVLADIAQQIAVGAEHITFGDPDFFNGPAHALAVVRQLHDMFPELSYDVTIKIEHLVKYGRYLPILRDTGCVLITSAVEAFDQRILEILDKRHTLEDFGEAIRELRKAGIAINPTFVAFTPWTSLKVYIEVLATIHHYGLVGNVAPVQYAIRLLL
ncbi:MAG TPA: CUAEP/CCAEP-tail radical SAM protein, partial [Mycobacterium sp.]|nr:CUAEP/CCAEP-tail radical SAM protein [Mycobacterium sp.]